MELRPQQSHSVVRQIANHLDTDVNYVQAVIRNAHTDAIIETIQLTDKTGQRFIKNWQVPADPSGQGFYISIVTSVYTSSAYTTKNANYGDEENTYLVRSQMLGGQGGGIDSFTVRQIIIEELGKLPKPEKVKIPEQKEMVMRWDDVLNAIKEVKGAIKPFPIIPKTDLAPVISAVKEVRQAVQDKEVTPEADSKPILEAINNSSTTVMEIIKNFGERQGDILISIIKKTITLEMSKVKSETPPIKKPAAQPIPFDITKLAS